MPTPLIEVRSPTNRYKNVNYLDDELITLAKMRYQGCIKDEYKNPDLKMLMRNCLSLERFGLADYGGFYVGNQYSGWAWCVTDEGTKLLESMEPRWEGCKCKHAIRLSCVCSERTYCPNPEHTNNGCHGGHD